MNQTKPPIQMDIIFIKRVPANLKAQFKAFCARRRKTMTEMIINLIEETINKEIPGEDQ